MVKKATLIKTPTGYESECTHCGTTNFSKDAESQLVCKMCNKEYLATVAHTEEWLIPESSRFTGNTTTA